MKQPSVISISKAWFDEERAPVSGAKRVIVRPALKLTDSTRFITVKAAALIMGVSIYKVYDLMKSGKLRWQPIGRSKRTTREWVEDYLNLEATLQGAG